MTSGNKTEYRDLRKHSMLGMDELTYKLESLLQQLPQDIPELKKAIEKLSLSEKRYRSVVENIDLGISLIGLDHRIIMPNAAQCRMFKKTPEDMINRHCYEVYEKGKEICPHCPGVETMRTGQICEVETFGVRDDGSRFEVFVRTLPVTGADGDIVGFMEIAEDITDKKRYKLERARVQRIESMAILAAGIAHDFNNLLSGVASHLSMAMVRGNSEESGYRNVELANEAVIRAKALTDQLLSFSKGGEPVKKPIDLGVLLERSARFALSGSNCFCELAIEPGLWRTEGDVGQLEQVINNLVINADQATPAGGIVRIAANNITIPENSPFPLASGRYLKIEISDTGRGIPEDIQDKVFHPYFTTKKQGSGLGLAITHSIIEKHGGHISIESIVERGTTVTFYLVASQSVEDDLPDQEVPDTGACTGRILLMDDDAFIRDIALEMLFFMGFECHGAEDGRSAIEKYRSALAMGQPYDLVILDLTIQGGMGGEQVLSRLREIDADIKAVVTSGYSNNPILTNYSQWGFCAALTKPYNIKNLKKLLPGIMRGTWEH